MTVSSPAVVEVSDGLLGVLLPLELDKDVAHQVVTQVVAHVHLLHLPRIMNDVKYAQANQTEKSCHARAG